MSTIFMAAGIVGSIIAIFLIIWKIIDSSKKEKRREESMKKRTALDEALKNTAFSEKHEKAMVITYNGQEFRFSLDSKVTIGRGNDNDIVLSDGRVSRLHCVIRSVKNDIIISDNNSRNGTMIIHNDIQIVVEKTGTKIVSGDRIALGKNLLLFTVR